jgi:3-oxoacyl-[acyl-carrier protein] reductase
MAQLQNKRALITGSSSGIGAGVAVRYAAEGAKVVVNYPNPSQRDNAEKVVATIEAKGGNAWAVQADVASEADVASLVDAAVTAMGGIDILVNNAGIAAASPVEETPVELWDSIIAVHLRGTFLMTRQVIPLLYKQSYGKIINTASQLAYLGSPGFSHYTAAKGAILSFTRSVALEIGKRNVNINCVAPGATMTPMLEPLPEELLDAIRQKIPKGKIATVADIVPTYLFLATDAAQHFQGQCLSPNGGDAFL